MEKEKIQKADMTKEEFENKCMEVIEQIVSIDINQTREGAIKVAQSMVDKAMETGKKRIIELYERVLNEFEIATDKEYELLREAIFSYRI